MEVSNLWKFIWLKEKPVQTWLSFKISRDQSSTMQKITTCLRSILKLIYKFWKKKKEEEAVRVSVEPHSDFRSKQKLPNKQIFCSDSATLHENHLNIWWDLINQGNPLQSNSCWVMSCILVWQVASNWRSQISYSCTKFISQVIHMPLHESQFWSFFYI